jgi:hypothetical protein
MLSVCITRSRSPTKVAVTVPGVREDPLQVTQVVGAGPTLAAAPIPRSRERHLVHSLVARRAATIHPRRLTLRPEAGGDRTGL